MKANVPCKFGSTKCKTGSHKNSTETLESIAECAWVVPIVETKVACLLLVTRIAPSL